jgi:RNA polymerase sigma-70 factor (sigma-E family)
LDAAFGEFVAERADSLLRYGYLITGNPHDAADLVQEALVRLHRSWHRVRAKQDPERYTRTIMTRQHISAWRGRRRERLTWDPPETSYEDSPAADQDEGLWELLAELPKKQRAVLVLRHYEQLSDEEIAAVLGVSRGTVRSHASLGLGRLRARVERPEASRIDTPKGVFASAFAVGAERVFWQTIQDFRTRFWSVPLAGGSPSELKVEGGVDGRGDALAVVGDRLAFSLIEGGVFTVPVEGGAATPVPGGERHHILRWPWVGTPGHYTPNGETSFQELLNAETGEKSTALVRPGESLSCGVRTCWGPGPDGWSFHRLRDGSRQRELPRHRLGLGVAADRFVLVQAPGVGQPTLLLDLETGRSAELGIRPNSPFSAMHDPRLVFHEVGGEYVIVDLSRIR